MIFIIGMAVPNEKTGEAAPTLFLLDGVNQLAEGLGALRWLPKDLPANVRLVISADSDAGAAEDFAAYEASARSLEDEDFLYTYLQFKAAVEFAFAGHKKSIQIEMKNGMHF